MDEYAMEVVTERVSRQDHVRTLEKIPEKTETGGRLVFGPPESPEVWNETSLVMPVRMRVIGKRNAETVASSDIKTVDMMGNVRARARRGTKFEVALGHGRPVYLVFAETTAKQAGRWLSAAAVLETPLWHIDVSQRPEARIEVRITSKADRPLDAAVWMACQPQVRVTPAQRFVLDVPPGGTRVLTFRCEAGAAPLASVTATVGSGPFRMRETQVAKPLPR